MIGVFLGYARLHWYNALRMYKKRKVRDVVTRNMTYTAKGYATARGPSRLSVDA